MLIFLCWGWLAKSSSARILFIPDKTWYVRTFFSRLIFFIPCRHKDRRENLQITQILFIASKLIWRVMTSECFSRFRQIFSCLKSSRRTIISIILHEFVIFDSIKISISSYYCVRNHYSLITVPIELSNRNELQFRKRSIDSYSITFLSFLDWESEYKKNLNEPKKIYIYFLITYIYKKKKLIYIFYNAN